ncbi:MAG: transcriptional regulator, LysR family [Anaerosporomusa subterranea]|jgi:DNA-binding transcriptional LysR family regulator|nr:transcriptional regulator, LysR family [Anaerosporomusa subterranea]
MDIKQLKYFRAIVEEGHITGAAKRLFMTQPSLSQQLKLLETELGVRLVERGSRHITLTEAGRLLRDRAGQILDLLYTTEIELKELHEGYKGTLALGTIASSGVTLLPGLLRDFHQQFPNVKFQLWEGDTYRILDLLNNGLIEVGIARSVFDLELYHSISLPSEPMIVAMSDKWDCVQTAAITVAELADKPLLLHHSYEPMILESCHQAGFTSQVLCKGDDVRTLLVLASEGFGLAIVPRSALGLVPSHGLRYKEITGSLLMIKKSIVWLRQRNLSTSAKRFINMVLED